MHIYIKELRVVHKKVFIMRKILVGFKICL